MVIAHELTRADLDDGKFASRMASDPRVKAFAAAVVKDASARLYRLEHLMSEMGVPPHGNDLSEQIRTDERRRMDQLKAMSGVDFDRAFIDGQIDYFRLALDTYDHLIASAKDREIKANLAEGRALASKYLLEARTLRASLASE
jgi:putative membrane protein